jgi:hypothetical protein
MHFKIYHFIFLALLAFLVQSNSIPGIRAEDEERSNALGEILDNSINFRVKAEAIMPRIKEWFFYTQFQSTFSAITNSSSVFTKLAEYVVESVRGRHYNASFAYSSNENETTVEFEEGLVKGLKLTLLFRASEHGFRGREFHRLCDGKGPTIAVVMAMNGRMAAAYSGVDWGENGRIPNPQGFLASIVDDPGEIGGYSLQKYAANDHAYVFSYPPRGPWFGDSLYIADRCSENENSYSFLGPEYLFGLNHGGRCNETNNSFWSRGSVSIWRRAF